MAGKVNEIACVEGGGGNIRGQQLCICAARAKHGAFGIGRNCNEYQPGAGVGFAYHKLRIHAGLCQHAQRILRPWVGAHSRENGGGQAEVRQHTRSI